MDLPKEKLETSLTRIKMYWKQPQNGHKYITFYSLDAKKDIYNNNPEPGILGLERRILKNKKYIFRYKFAILYNNQGLKEKLWEYNEMGQRVWT